MKTIEQINNFEQLGYLETERKFVAKNAYQFEALRPYADTITQLYLSSPLDDYSLRLRHVEQYDGTEVCTATLKSRGRVTEHGLSRMEVETPISREAFHAYSADASHPVLRKRRASLGEGVTIDWIEGSDTPIIEVENIAHNERASEFLATFQDDLIERTGYSDVDNETLAYEIAGKQYEHAPVVTTQEIIEAIAAYRLLGQQKLVIGIGGRSGSGKSTLARELQLQIAERFGETAERISTDDYHHGKAYLEATYGAPWTNWEDAKVYDTQEAAADAARFYGGETVHRRSFDFARQEPQLHDPLAPSNVLIVEGIHAGSKDLASVRHMYYEVPTPFATSLGRDLARLVETDRQQAAMKSPEARLRYMVEIGEPTYRQLPSARRNVFSANVRGA